MFVLKLKPCSRTGKRNYPRGSFSLGCPHPLKSLPIYLREEKAPPCCGHHSARQVHTLSQKRYVCLQNLQTWLTWKQVICRSNQMKMRSYSIQMGPNPNQVLPLLLWKEKRHRDKKSGKETEIGGMHLQAKECQQHRKWGEWPENRSFPKAIRESRICQHLPWGLVAPGIIRDYISVVLSCPIFRTLLQQY